MNPGAFAVARGYRQERFASVASTNDVAMSRARDSDAGRLWIVAQAQTSGRGRLGRVWSSTPGNLFASLLLMDVATPAVTPQLGFVAGVALIDALDAIGIRPGLARLKWPNDALIDGAKVAGVLLEATTLPTGAFACVIGIGVNCASHPEGLPYPATSLAAHGASATPDDLIQELADAMARAIDLWDGGAGFARVRQAWLARAAGLGAPIEIVSGARRLAGVFRAIDEQGRLVLAAETGDIVVEAGDVAAPNPSARDGGGQGNI